MKTFIGILIAIFCLSTNTVLAFDPVGAEMGTEDDRGSVDAMSGPTGPSTTPFHDPASSFSMNDGGITATDPPTTPANPVDGGDGTGTEDDVEGDTDGEGEPENDDGVSDPEPPPLPEATECTSIPENESGSVTCLQHTGNDSYEIIEISQTVEITDNTVDEPDGGTRHTYRIHRITTTVTTTYSLNDETNTYEQDGVPTEKEDEYSNRMVTVRNELGQTTYTESVIRDIHRVDGEEESHEVEWEETYYTAVTDKEGNTTMKPDFESRQVWSVEQDENGVSKNVYSVDRITWTTYDRHGNVTRTEVEEFGETVLIETWTDSNKNGIVDEGDVCTSKIHDEPEITYDCMDEEVEI